MINRAPNISMTTPQIAIGMPVYNGEKYIRKALDSLLAQTFGSYEIIISDNASTDTTGVICREYAERDRRVRYIRQPENQGATKNFKLVLDQAGAEYFMWAACDDIRSADFLEINYRFLQDNPDYVASTCPVRFEGGEFDEIRMGDASLTTSVPERITEMFIRPLHANGRFYSLIRHSAIKDCPLLREHFLGSDWGVVLYLAAQGKLNRARDGWVVLGRDGLSGSSEIFRAYRKSWFDFFLPFHRLTRYTWSLSYNFSNLAKIKLGTILLALNLKGIYAQINVAMRRKSDES